MTLLEILKQLFKDNEHKATKRKQKEEEWKRKRIDKGVKSVIRMCKEAAKDGYSYVEVSLYDFVYEDVSDEIIQVLKKDHNLYVISGRMDFSVGGWGKK